MSGFEGETISRPMNGPDQFALSALLEEMRVFFHQDHLGLKDHNRWWEANYKEFVGLVSKFTTTLSAEEQGRLEEIADRTDTSMDYGKRTRSQRLGGE